MMNIIKLISDIFVSDGLKGISQIIVIIGGVFVFYQWKHNSRLKKVIFITM